MSYKWKPSKNARREFAQKMQTDTQFANNYENRKKEREDKRRKKSSFDYQTAGGNYVPTKNQYDFAMSHNYDNDAEKIAFDMVVYGYSCNEKISHDYIHVVNEKIRTLKD
jgi:hypothetical protein